MLKLDLFDESFDINRTETYELSIQLTLNGFSFTVKDTVRNSFIALFSLPFETELDLNTDWLKVVKQMVTGHNLLLKQFKKVVFNFQNPNFTVVPKEYFSPEKAKSVLGLVCSIPELDEVRYSNTTSDIVSIFTIPTILATEWIKIQPNTKFVGTGEPLLLLGSVLANRSNSTILVSNSKPYPYLTFFSLGKLKHCGSIFAQNQNDTAYHIINICQKLNLTLAETSVFVMGPDNETEQLAILLGKYFKSSSLSLPSELHHYTYQLLRYKNQFSALFNLLLCE